MRAELNARREQSEKLGLVVEELEARINDNLKMVDHGNKLLERVMTKLNITERPTEKDLQELRKRILTK